MPVKYYGETLKKNPYAHTVSRKWTDQEIKWMLNMLEQKQSIQSIALSMNRSKTSIKVKIKRLKKRDNTYNQNHLKEKIQLNKCFLDYIRPDTILDLYCGTGTTYKGFNITTNDKNKLISADYNCDAYKLICLLYYKNKKYDYIDLDPFGSAYDCFDLAIKMAKKGIAITLGELGHKRWKRLDFVRPRYNINTFKDFTIDTIIQYIQQIGVRNKKKLTIWNYKEWDNTGRVYFVIKPIKITEQWKDKNKEIV